MDRQNRSDISWHCVQSAGTSLHCVQSAGTSLHCVQSAGTLWNCVQSADKMFISRAQSKDIVNTGDPRELDIFWMGSTQLVGRGGRQGGRHSFPLGWQWRLGQWPLFETCFPGTSFPVSETCRGPLALPIFQRVIFSFGVIWNACLHSQTGTLNDLKEAIRLEICPIDRQLLARVMDDFKKKAWKLHPRRRSSSYW